MTFSEALALADAAGAALPPAAAVAPAPALAPVAASSTTADPQVACEPRAYRAPGLHRGGGRTSRGGGNGRGSGSFGPRSLGFGGPSSTTPQTGPGQAPSTSRDPGSTSGDIGSAAGPPVPFPGFAPATEAMDFEAQMEAQLAANPNKRTGRLAPRHGKPGVPLPRRPPNDDEKDRPPGKRRRQDGDGAQ